MSYWRRGTVSSGYKVYLTAFTQNSIYFVGLSILIFVLSLLFNRNYVAFEEIPIELSVIGLVVYMLGALLFFRNRAHSYIALIFGVFTCLTILVHLVPGLIVIYFLVSILSLSSIIFINLKNKTIPTLIVVTTSIVLATAFYEELSWQNLLVYWFLYIFICWII